MEFSIKIRASVLRPDANDPAAEHRKLTNELALIRQADRYWVRYA